MRFFCIVRLICFIFDLLIVLYASSYTCCCIIAFSNIQNRDLKNHNFPLPRDLRCLRCRDYGFTHHQYIRK